ncbi:THAP domain-containing protein 2 [Merluccius polli]|uniref:THAP domain-containing protein 2 n=1 Tax=Merluccius polli TaxID=89951 RepID=A0AA47NTF9_MERPO|nr:THAP domain-containing protein 2 [Merluccius polli]
MVRPRPFANILTVKWCSAVSCVVITENDVNKTISYYRFPLDEKDKKRWLKLIRRDKFTPNYNSRVCGWHFPDGKAAGPTRFACNDGKAFPDHIPTKRKKGMVPASVEDEGTAGPGPNHLDVATQTPGTSNVVVLEIENDMLRKENDQLKRELEKQKQTFSFSQISSHPDKVNYYTGLPDAATVLFLEALLSKFDLQYHFDWNVQIMPLIDQLLLTLMKLRLNFTNIFTTISSALYDILYVGMMDNNIPSRVKNQTSLPDCFQPFPDCRIVLDCTEVAVSNTERLDTQSHLYILIGVAPNGVITFSNDLYGGSTSDKVITADCGVLQQLEPGDTVMADKGFTIRDILPQGVSLNIPTFLVNGQFTVQEVNHNRLVASARIHVERSIHLKTFDILTYIPYQYKKHANKILKVCVCLTNLQKPILREIA